MIALGSEIMTHGTKYLHIQEQQHSMMLLKVLSRQNVSRSQTDIQHDRFVLVYSFLSLFGMDSCGFLGVLYFYSSRATFLTQRRGVYEIKESKYILMTDRPATDRRPTSHFENFKWPYLCNQSSDPLHVRFQGWVFGDGGSNGAISGSKNPRWRPPPSWKNFKWPYLRNRSSDLLHVWFQVGAFGDGGFNGAISANRMYGQFTCVRRQHHITSLLMRKTLELDFVWQGRVAYGSQAIQFRGRK